MEINEFFLRLQSVSGQKLSAIRAIFYDKNQQIEEINEKEILNRLNLNHKQISQFWEMDSKKLDFYLHWIEKNEHFYLHYFHPCYPPKLRQIASSPLAIFVKGNLENCILPQIAMIGSRNFSFYGEKFAVEFAQQLALNSLIISSGLARGIDSICHRAVLNVRGRTLAVLGSGIEKITPTSHIGLSERILEENGTIVSEFFPDQNALPEHFPRRNRIISGLADAIFVIEAGIKSGSLITARYAIEQNKDVFALPGPIDSETSQGTHWLIQQGAYLVTDPNDILVHFNLEKTTNHSTQTKSTVKMSQSLYPEIINMINYQPILVDVLAENLQENVSDLTIKLMELELAGEIKRLYEGYVRT